MVDGFSAKGCGQEVVSGPGNAIVAARSGRRLRFPRLRGDFLAAAKSLVRQDWFPGRSCRKRFESRLTPWVAMSARQSLFPAPRSR